MPDRNEIIGGGTPVKINDQYFSGVQCSLFIGDIWIDDVVAIEYNVVSQRTPIYGYGSQHYDLFPKGIVVVQGAFTINFREPNYLNVVLARYKRLFSGASPTRPDRAATLNEAIRDDNNTFEGDPRVNLERFFDAKPEDAQEVASALGRTINQAPESGVIDEAMNHPFFDISIGYGDNMQEALGEKIRQVQIVNKSKVIEQDGRPVMETYQFIARDKR
jgi:hypothetical protein